MRLLGVAVLAAILAVASTNTITVTSWCPISIIGKCPETTCPVPQQVELRYGDSYTWTVPSDWGGRIYGHPVLPGLDNDTYFDALLEFGFINSGTFAGGSFYDVSFVDMFVVPTILAPVTAVGASQCKPNGCNATWAATQECPKGTDYDLTHASGRGCWSSAEFCRMNPNSSYCRRLDGEIQRCYSEDPYKSAGCSGLKGPPVITTAQAYAGTPGFGFNKGNVYNAALNRGVLSSIDDQDMTHWYNFRDINCQPMYNEYSKWVRDHCAGTVNNIGYPYSFSTDDVNNGGATSYCLTTDVNIYFCPADAPGITAPTPTAFTQTPCSPSTTVPAPTSGSLHIAPFAVLLSTAMVAIFLL